MAAPSGIGMLAVIENGEPRFLPLEFYIVDGMLYSAAGAWLEQCDGQHVQVLLFNPGYDLLQIDGVLRCSHDDDDRARLRESLAYLLNNDLVVKIIPQDIEVLTAIVAHLPRKAA